MLARVSGPSHFVPLAGAQNRPLSPSQPLLPSGHVRRIVSIVIVREPIFRFGGSLESWRPNSLQV